MCNVTIDCWQKFKDLFLNLEDEYIPMKKIRPNKRKKTVWMSYKALKCVRKKRKVFAKYKDKDHPRAVARILFQPRQRSKLGV